MVKKTTKRGLRPFNDGIIPSLERPAQEIKKWVEEVLSDNQPKERDIDIRDIYILKRVKKAAERLATQNEIQKESLLLELKRLEKEGQRLKFSQEENWGANAAALLIKKEGWLEKFIQQAENKLEETK